MERVPKSKSLGTIWFTGLPCSGKTTIATHVNWWLNYNQHGSITLDGDDLRARLNTDLGFSPEDRRENLRRVAHICQLMNEKDITVVASFVSPSDEARQVVKDIVKNITWVYVKCSPEECERRDVKGMWAKARAGEIKDFTGVGAPYAQPEDPDLVVDTEADDIHDCVKAVMAHIRSRLTARELDRPASAFQI